jgi:hypothetical protein
MVKLETGHSHEADLLDRFVHRVAVHPGTNRKWGIEVVLVIVLAALQ